MGDARDEERISARLFALVRAGRYREAHELCNSVGQPWRSAVLGKCQACVFCASRVLS